MPRDVGGGIGESGIGGGPSAILVTLLSLQRIELLLGGNPAQVDDTCRGAAVEFFTDALKSRRRHRIGLARTDIELLTAFAALVGINQAEMLIHAFVHRCGGGDRGGRPEKRADDSHRRKSFERRMMRWHRHKPLSVLRGAHGRRDENALDEKVS